MDSNKDGSLTRAEVEASRANFINLTKAVITKEMQQEFTASDTDKNGKVTLAELTAAAPAARKASAGQAFERLDANKDKGISLTELTAAAPNLKLGGTDQFMQRFDADKDGKVTAAEYPKAALAAFDLADTNKDGTLSAQEKQAARKKR
jgi:Ca2+-binding EF-hand superfamily protein